MTAPVGAHDGGDVGSSISPPAEWWWQGRSGGRERSAFPLPLLATKSSIFTWPYSRIIAEDFRYDLLLTMS